MCTESREQESQTRDSDRGQVNGGKVHLNLNAGWVMMKSCESPEVPAGLDFLLCGKAETG